MGKWLRTFLFVVFVVLLVWGITMLTRAAVNPVRTKSPKIAAGLEMIVGPVGA